jgi:transcriptional regulator with XRE-family HTH domain
MSLNALAEEAGISPSHLSRMERGLTVPSYDVLYRVADALGSDLRALRQEEEQAKVVDSELNSLLVRLGMPESTQTEFLRLSSRTRMELVSALRAMMS